MPQSFSDLSSSLTNHSIKHVYSSKHKNNLHKQKLRPCENRPRSSSSFSSSSSASSPSLSSSSASIDTVTTANEINHPHVMVGGGPPTLQQIELVRNAWEKICELRQEKDGSSVSPAHAFGLLFYKALFDLDPALKPKLNNVIQQARVLADIMSYLTRSPSAKGKPEATDDFKLRNSSSKKKKSLSSMHSITTTVLEGNDHADDKSSVDLACQASLSKDLKTTTLAPPSPPSPPPPIHHRQHPSTIAIEKHYSDDVCPFYQQEQEEKYQQQLLLQQQHQEEQERQRSSIQRNRHEQLQRKLAVQHQEDNQWFAYRLREVGIQYVEEYDLDPENLDAFGPALSSALKLRLHDELTPIIEQAWNQAAMFTFYHLKTGVEAHVAYHRRARRLSSGSYCSIEAGETNGACTIQ